MKVFFGTERCVIAFPQLGLVLKVPSVHRVSWLRRKSLSIPQKLHRVLRDAWFIARRGWAQNRREAQTWRALPDVFLARTYFSLYGLVNVQKYYSTVMSLERAAEFFEKMRAVLGSNREVVAIDAHSWFQPANHAILDDGSLCKLDYGGENDLDVLRCFLPKLKQIRM